MKSETAGSVTISTEYVSEQVQSMCEEVMQLIRDSYEDPFVAIRMYPEDNKQDSTYVVHSEDMGMLRVVERINDIHIDEPYWKVSSKQPFQWAMEDIVNRYDTYYSEFEVEIMDIEVARARLAHDDGEVKGSKKLVELVESDLVKDNRKMAFAPNTSTPKFMYRLITQPAYDKDDALEAIKQHQAKMQNRVQ